MRSDRSKLRGPPLFLIAIVAAFPIAASADVIVLDNGGSFTGVITYESDKVVTIKSEGTVWTFERSKIVSLEKEAAGRSSEAQSDRTRREGRQHAASHSQVVVYGTTWCGYCRKARAYFNRHNIYFEDKDIEKDPSARAEVVRKCAAAGNRFNGSVPVIDVHGHILHGFSEQSIEVALRDR